MTTLTRKQQEQNIYDFTIGNGFLATIQIRGKNRPTDHQNLKL